MTRRAVHGRHGLIATWNEFRLVASTWTFIMSTLALCGLLFASLAQTGDPADEDDDTGENNGT